MQSASEDVRLTLLPRVQEHLRRVEARSQRLRRANLQLVAGSLATSAIATAVAGLTAVMGPLAGQGPPAWRWTCGLVALVTAASGLLTGLHQRLSVPEQLARAIACAGRLRALELGLSLSQRDAKDAVRDYEEIVATHADLLT